MNRRPFSLMVYMIPDYWINMIKIPQVQREPKVWSVEQKQNFIDSIYNDFDIPKIYFRIKPQDTNTWWLIDGHQRISTVNEFLNNEFAIGDVSSMPTEIRNKKFRQLTPQHKGIITSRILDCVIVECDDDEEEDMFTRLNNGTPLSAAEKRNAITGELRDFVKRNAKHRFFKSKVNFTSRRFAHDAVCAQLTSICIEDGPTDTKGKSLKKLYDDYRRFPEKTNIQRRLSKILNLLNRIFTQKEPYMKKYNVTSVFLFLHDLSNKYTVTGISPQQWYTFFNDFEIRRIHNSQISEDDPNYDNDLGRYQFTCVNSPDNETSIRTRNDILLKNFFVRFINIEPLDPIRDFSEHQKIAIYYLSDRKCSGISGCRCQNSGRSLPFEECEFDHIVEHSRGGKTTVANGQVLCTNCHAYKTQMYRTQIRN